MVGEAAEYNSACANTLRRSLDGNYSPAAREIWQPFRYHQGEHMPHEHITSHSRKPDPVDLNAGAILYAYRCWRGLSQEKLAAEIGMSYQQIQKYETGKCRMAASTLYKIARVLDMSVNEFFSGLDGVWPETNVAYLSKDEIRLLKIYRSINGTAHRRHMMKLLEAMSGM